MTLLNIEQMIKEQMNVEVHHQPHLPGIRIFLWWFFQGCSPLPIPNRVVKPLMADGTAQQCGRVGSCHIYLKSLSVQTERLFWFWASGELGVVSG